MGWFGVIQEWQRLLYTWHVYPLARRDTDSLGYSKIKPYTCATPLHYLEAYIKLRIRALEPLSQTLTTA